MTWPYLQEYLSSHTKHSLHHLLFAVECLAPIRGGSHAVVELLRVIYVVHSGDGDAHLVGGILTEAGHLLQFPGCPSGGGDSCDSTEGVPDYNSKK